MSWAWSGGGSMLGKAKQTTSLRFSLIRLDFDANAEILGAIERDLQPGMGRTVIGDCREEGFGPGGLLIQWRIGLQHQTHASGAVVGLVKGDQLIADLAAGSIAQGLPVADENLTQERSGLTVSLWTW